MISPARDGQFLIRSIVIVAYPRGTFNSKHPPHSGMPDKDHLAVLGDGPTHHAPARLYVCVIGFHTGSKTRRSPVFVHRAQSRV